MTPLRLAAAALLALVALKPARAASATSVSDGWRFKAPSRTRSQGLSLAATTSGSSSANAYGIWAEYESSTCSDVPALVAAESDCAYESYSEYSDADCFPIGGSGSSSGESSFQDISAGTAFCSADIPSALDKLYGDQAYIRVDFFNGTDCSNYMDSNVFVADSKCHAMSYIDMDTGEPAIHSRIATIRDNGDASVTWFVNVSDCTNQATYNLTISKEQLSDSSCNSNRISYLNPKSTSSSSDAGLATGAIVGIVVGCAAFLGLVAGFVLWRRHQSRQSINAEAEIAKQLVADRVSVQGPETPDQLAAPYRSDA